MADRTLVGTVEAARQIGVAYQTLSDWAAKGRYAPAERTPGGHARWDVADLRRQLGRHDEQTALEPLRIAYAAAVTLIRGLEDPHIALAIVAKLVAALRDLLEQAMSLRNEVVERLYSAEEMTLKPLAETVSKSARRRRREGEL